MTTQKIKIGTDLQDTVNARVYHSSGIAREYRSQDMTRCEVTALLKYQPAFAGHDVLDLGVGTGRTTIYIAPLARRYEAIDYSPVMVAHVKKNLPGISVRLGDIRDLSDFADGSFDMVFGANNVLDAVSHKDRARALSEASRVLRDGGLLLFTSHNRLYCEAQQWPTLERSKNPVTQVLHVIRFVRRVANHLRIRPLCQFGPEFALLNDEGHDYACLHYYIDPIVQRRHLSALGFSVIDVLDHVGQSIAETDTAPVSPWLMYVAARK